MTDLPTVSIVTRCFNAAQTIGRCLDSVWRQRDAVLEHIVVDASSTDGTVDILEGMAAERGDFMVVESRPDRGIAHGFNRGIALARGEWIGIVNADDWYEDGAVSRLRPVMAQGDAILHGRIRQHDSRTGTVREVGKLHYDPKRHFRPLPAMAAQHPTCFVPRAVYERVGGYAEGFRIAMDFDFLQRAHLAGVAFTYLPEVITNFSRHGASGQDPARATREMLASQILHQRAVLRPLAWYLGKRLRLALR